mgnify:CR=1 FL=1
MKEDEDIHPAYLEQVQKVALARAVQPGHGHDRDGALHRLQHAHGLVVHLELVRVRVDRDERVGALGGAARGGHGGHRVGRTREKKETKNKKLRAIRRPLSRNKSLPFSLDTPKLGLFSTKAN